MLFWGLDSGRMAHELRGAVSCNRLTYGPTVRLSCWWLRFEVQNLGCRGSCFIAPSMIVTITTSETHHHRSGRRCHCRSECERRHSSSTSERSELRYPPCDRGRAPGQGHEGSGLSESGRTVKQAMPMSVAHSLQDPLPKPAYVADSRVGRLAPNLTLESLVNYLGIPCVGADILRAERCMTQADLNKNLPSTVCHRSTYSSSLVLKRRRRRFRDVFYP